MLQELSGMGVIPSLAEPFFESSSPCLCLLRLETLSLAGTRSVRVAAYTHSRGFFYWFVLVKTEVFKTLNVL